MNHEILVEEIASVIRPMNAGGCEVTPAEILNRFVLKARDEERVIKAAIEAYWRVSDEHAGHLEDLGCDLEERHGVIVDVIVNVPSSLWHRIMNVIQTPDWPERVPQGSGLELYCNACAELLREMESIR